MFEALKKYRNHLIKADQKSQEDFDKTLLTVATSSLGVSLVFIREFVGDGPVASTAYILVGWSLLASSVGCVIFGFYLSRFALRKAIRQIDSGAIYSEKPGGRIAIVVEVLNGISGLLLLLGIAAVIYFAFDNLRVLGPSQNKEIVMANEKPVSDGQRGYVPPPPPPKPIGTERTGHQSGYIPPPPPPTPPPKK